MKEEMLAIRGMEQSSKEQGNEWAKEIQGVFWTVLMRCIKFFKNSLQVSPAVFSCVGTDRE